MTAIKSISHETRNRAIGRLTDGKVFTVVKHYGTGRFEIRNYNCIGKRAKYNTLSAEERALIAAHPIAVAIKALEV